MENTRIVVVTGVSNAALAFQITREVKFVPSLGGKQDCICSR